MKKISHPQIKLEGAGGWWYGGNYRERSYLIDLFILIYSDLVNYKYNLQSALWAVSSVGVVIPRSQVTRKGLVIIYSLTGSQGVLSLVCRFILVNTLCS